MTDLIFRRDHGFQLDHIGLGVPDTKAGVDWVRQKTGATIELHDPEPGQWYWSGSLSIGKDSFLEIIGPNPNYERFQPFAALMKTLREPSLLFWYIAVSNFQKFRALAKSQNATLERIEAINVDGQNDEHSGYWRGYIGPGFITERPNVIEWVHQSRKQQHSESKCQLTDFRLTNPKASKINTTFKALGIDVVVHYGPSSIGATIDTPNGPWGIENPGIKMTMPSMFFDFARLWWQTRNT